MITDIESIIGREGSGNGEDRQTKGKPSAEISYCDDRH
jgi:hypothetical protein